jgi:hypothetical protein
MHRPALSLIVGWQVTDLDRRWLKRFGRSPAAEIRLLFLHHAGSSAAMFRKWSELISPEIEPIAVQLPGERCVIDAIGDDPGGRRRRAVFSGS